MWHWVIQPAMLDKENAAKERQARIDEKAAEKIAKEALLVSEDDQQDLDARVGLLEELSAKMNLLTQTAGVAERIASVQNRLADLRAEIASADAAAQAAAEKGPITVDEDGVAETQADRDAGAGPQEKPVANPDTPAAKPEGGEGSPVKVARAKPKE